MITLPCKSVNFKPSIMTNVLTQAPSIGPGFIAQPQFSGGPGFALSAPEWLAIQIYVEDALALPTTMEMFKASLGSGAPSDLSDYTQLVAAYFNINSHATTWKKDTFPSNVSLASDIYNYALEAPTYYNPILPLAQKLVANTEDQPAKDELSAILGVLSKMASGYHDNAAAVLTKIQTFADQTLADKTVLSGTDGKTGLKNYYNLKYGNTSTDVQTLMKELADEKIILDAANADYHHDVIVASTTPTYGWWWPIGTVAAAIVAGIYGKKATDALEKAKAARQTIDGFTASLASDANLMIAINTAEAGIGNILDPLSAALPVIQKIQGVWGALSDDLNNIISEIKTNIQGALPIIMNLGVETAIKDWTAVGNAANAYRLNAYITVAVQK